jgi:Putative Flp pilus-assembly TadE/G-like
MSSSRAHGESGAVVVMVAALMPVIVLLLAFAVDASHWWVHKAHLQTQVDAGVWAGAQGPWLPACDNDAIEQTARQYSGDYSGNYAGPDPTYNDQYSNETNVHVLINADKYESLGGTEYADGGTPCASFLAGDGHLDLKASEKDLPNFLGSIPGFSVLPWTSDLANAHARVELRQISSAAGALPVAVPDPNPKAGAAIFIDESDGSIIRPPVQLNFVGLTNLNGASLAEWTSNQVGVDVREQTGVVIAFTGNPNWSTSGTLTDICGQPLVECYQGLDTGSWKGLGFVHGFPQQSGAVIVRDVYLTQGTCSDNSGPYFILNAGCSLGIKAQVEFPSGAENIKVSAMNTDLGCGGNGCSMSLDADGYWTATGLTVPAAAGPLDIGLDWSYKPASGGNVNGGLASQQRVYSASADPLLSGPIEYVSVTTFGLETHSEETGNKELAVRVGIQGSLEYAQGVSDPIVKLRVIGGSRNQSLDCDPNYSNLADELANGCRPRYAINAGTPCGTSVPALWGSPQPWVCVATAQGNATNQVAKGMNLRVLGDEKPTTCTSPNNWKDLDGDGQPDYQPGDPRLLFAFVAPFGSFQTGSGQTTVAVTNFAMFYVTGWTGRGQGFDNPCEPPGGTDDPSPGPAYIVGHFVKYAGIIEGGEGEDPCVIGDPAVIAPCVAVLTD